MKIMPSITAALAMVAAASGQYTKQPDGSIHAPRNPDGTCPPLPPPEPCPGAWAPAFVPAPVPPKAKKD